MIPADNSSDANLTFDACVERLQAALMGALPGMEAHLRMAPEYRQSANSLSIEGKPCSEAAVLVLIVPVQGEACVVLTLRHSGLSHHAGQISFPGGRREPDEDLASAALREALEEVGLAVPVELIGSLSPLYIPPSNFCVSPFVATLPSLPPLRPQEEEVEAILYVPLAALLDPASRAREQRAFRGVTGWVPYYTVGGQKIWGATAMILSELLELLAAFDPDRP